MNILLKRRMVWFGFLAAAGLILFAVDIFKGMNSDTVTSFASALFIGAVAKLVQYCRISKNPQLLRRFEIQQKEERFITIAEKSGRFTFILSLFGQFIAIFVLILNGQESIAAIISTVTAIQTLIYLITYYYFCKKY